MPTHAPRFLFVLGTAMCAATAALACSGPGASALIDRNMLIGYVGVGVTVAVAVALSLVVGKSRVRNAAIILALTHPGIWIGASSGDCGFMRRDATFLFGAMILVVIAIAIVQRVRRRRASST